MQSLTGGENAAFDLGTLTSGERAVVKDCASEVSNFVRRTARDALAVGRKLRAVKGILGHGRFLAWLRDEGTLSADTAERLMKIAERFGDIPHNAEFVLTALYALAADDTPEAAREEAVGMAAKGEKITPAVAKAIKARHAAAAVEASPLEKCNSDAARPDDTPTHGAAADSLEGRDAASSPSAPIRAEPAGRATKSREGVRGGDETNGTKPGAVPSAPLVRSESVGPDELVEAIDRLLAVMPADGQPGWDTFVRKAKRLAADERRALVGRLRKLADATAKVRRQL